MVNTQVHTVGGGDDCSVSISRRFEKGILSNFGIDDQTGPIPNPNPNPNEPRFRISSRVVTSPYRMDLSVCQCGSSDFNISIRLTFHLLGTSGKKNLLKTRVSSRKWNTSFPFQRQEWFIDVVLLLLPSCRQWKISRRLSIISSWRAN